VDERTTISIPADSEGFISRRCPACSKLFKVRYGQGSDQPLAHCPYCNTRGDGWFTAEQRAYVEAVTQNFAQGVVGRKLDEMARGFNRSVPRGGFITAKMTHKPSPRRPVPSVPIEPEEPMPVITFGCCNETVKHDGSTAALHCVICGAEARR
jgi:hypothetical protein